jgi:hypothetical protein
VAALTELILATCAGWKRSGRRHDPRGDVDRDPADVAVPEFHGLVHTAAALTRDRQKNRAGHELMFATNCSGGSC